MLPLNTLIHVNKDSKVPIYQQIIERFISLIQVGTLKKGQKIMSSRKLSELLGLHRKTITIAYEELILQGWLETKQSSGTFVANNLPEIVSEKLIEMPISLPKKAGFNFEQKPVLRREVVKAFDKLHLDDGFPDPRLAPLLDLARAYRGNLIHGNSYVKLGYGDTKGSYWLRQELATYLNESRGLKITAENVLIVRGTMMGMYLLTTAFVKIGDFVVLGEMTWASAKINFQHAGAKILNIPTDENGIVVDALEELCEKYPIRLIYVTSHHDYPTTVTLKADRRIKLLKLAEKYRFIIFEDDYDYDFHYQSKPLLPLASADEVGVVLYSGSFTKSISPAFRVGYLVAPEEVIEHLSYHRRIIDRQGDTMLENAIAELLHEGVIQKYLRKSLREYRERRDFFCELLQQKLRNEVSFQIPEGGMSVWTKFDKSIDLVKTAENALKNGLYFSNGVQHSLSDRNLNATRLGFASSKIEELEKCVEILKKSI
ncbi:transcriptional regulator, GntR family with aminotransferase domain [Emticicia oligotrophica DSM 17448]|uniref:Transcriptional regulator, GntR family with aminotransferase domain n=1 Tax=Emticicia oligotrophica (strain DSM 17448 / CIP 109782 / MTCC 6937 / GPTSA100-15) TaxID=929562 RepID=A0ABM5MXV0_EMTOG|nr:PLP-dependent aminotransferase family protein [Emticicia oligotrophica]AFK01915.1 transcriptional regulator, GntR family with aminotransferase domain [Emticicia oligotrophica DSM 17448]